MRKLVLILICFICLVGCSKVDDIQTSNFPILLLEDQLDKTNNVQPIESNNTSEDDLDIEMGISILSKDYINTKFIKSLYMSEPSELDEVNRLYSIEEINKFLEKQYISLSNDMFNMTVSNYISDTYNEYNSDVLKYRKMLSDGNVFSAINYEYPMVTWKSGNRVYFYNNGN